MCCCGHRKTTTYIRFYVNIYQLFLSKAVPAISHKLRSFGSLLLIISQTFFSYYKTGVYARCEVEPSIRIIYEWFSCFIYCFNFIVLEVVALYPVRMKKTISLLKTVTIKADTFPNTFTAHFSRIVSYNKCQNLWIFIKVK